MPLQAVMHFSFLAADGPDSGMSTSRASAKRKAQEAKLYDAALLKWRLKHLRQVCMQVYACRHLCTLTGNRSMLLLASVMVKWF